MHWTSRRGFLQGSAVTVLGAGAGWSLSSRTHAEYRSPNERPVLGFIGAGLRYGDLIYNAAPFGPCAAICDVDAGNLRRANEVLNEVYEEEGLSAPRPRLYEDYRHVLDRSDIDAVVVATPDHWHTKVAVDAMRAGKDVYCEKPLTLTIAEGQLLQRVEEETGRVVQVGTQQRSGQRFQTAVALLRSGRIGKTKRLTTAIGTAPTCKPLPIASPPSELNWNRWLGPAPYVAYRSAGRLPGEGDFGQGVDDYGSEFPFGRSHAHFRWWYEYAGGKLTDWGAHHIDIAMWALDKSDGSIGRVRIDPLMVEHPIKMVDGRPVEGDRFNTATRFHLRITFADGIELDVKDNAPDLGFENGIMFQGSEGRFFVNRGRLTGRPVEELAENPLSDDAFTSLYPTAGGEVDEEEGHEDRTRAHMQCFFDCVKSRAKPISDVATHHRHLSICHAANIALRLDRTLTYDPADERFVDDEQANGFIARESRKGFEIGS